MNVGIPVMKCSLNPSTQVNKKTGKASKTCGVGSAWREMNDQRLGRDTTIDKSLTSLNVWMKGISDDNVEAKVKKEIERINENRRANGKRSLRSDAVSVAEIVEKPPISYMQNLTYEQRKQFLMDSHSVMEDLIHEWNPNWQIIASVQHHDEFGGLSAHNHELVMLTTVDKDGLLNMKAKNELNLKFFNFINKNYSVRMRERGYEVDDVRTYDRLSEEEKEERRLHPQEHGVDAYTYKQKKQEEMSRKLSELQMQTEQTEKRLEEKKTEYGNLEEDKKNLDKERVRVQKAQQEYESKASEAIETKKEYQEKIVELTNAPDVQKYEEVVNENKELKEEIKAKNKIIAFLEGELMRVKETMKLWMMKFEKISNELGNKVLSKLGFKDDFTHRELPTVKARMAFDESMKDVLHVNPSSLYVVPDREKDDFFCIIAREKGDNFILVEDGFHSRFDAEMRQKELKKNATELGIEVHNGRTLDKK